jgi:hypothetical protein
MKCSGQNSDGKRISGKLFHSRGKPPGDQGIAIEDLCTHNFALSSPADYSKANALNP